MKIILFCLQIFFFCFIAASFTQASEQSWKYKDWSVNNINGIVRYIANGSTVYGHEFGFIKMTKQCDKDILWVSWTTYEKGLESFVGSDATIQFRVGDTMFQSKVPLLTVYDATPILKLAAFTNFVADEKFISLLQTGKKIEVTIIYPNELVSKFDIKTDNFSLDGFSAARAKAEAFCKGLE
jgi:hypothetical protein